MRKNAENAVSCERPETKEPCIFLYLSISFDSFETIPFFLHRFTCKSRVKIQIESAFVNVQHV